MSFLFTSSTFLHRLLSKLVERKLQYLSLSVGLVFCCLAYQRCNRLKNELQHYERREQTILTLNKQKQQELYFLQTNITLLEETVEQTFLISSKLPRYMPTSSPGLEVSTTEYIHNKIDYDSNNNIVSRKDVILDSYTEKGSLADYIDSF
ncbi:unnamed protein product [Didymodactylos carnosus]|uniref:Uncharacterized protein n=1 Tax=Didymodactylos carnosus TaxID=1234261 RepID=A0A814DUQ9_9BILA|nr:unnamed protein product [Didymodactylos carnosus]CAF0960634.1 unnamed protein product [Didymodactylos carnosus]CAF3633282.1 unnamed protein product [Didymodactylos carnosus]CAF3735244.1 unnamed protein product [Didymodactylos carnosus]